MRTISALYLTMSLAGCATVPAAPEVTNDTIGNEIAARFVGRPLDDMVARYGVPNREIATGSGKSYSWDMHATYFEGLEGYWTCRLDAHVNVPPVQTVRLVGLSGKFGACVRFRP